jgi:hypothetical protein
MTRRKSLDSEGMGSGNSWNRAEIEEDYSAWGLIDQEEGCDECGYEGPLRSTRKGWKCTECRKIVIPAEMDEY